MRGLIFIFMAVLLVPLALAEEGELRKLEGSCDRQGNIEISMLHNKGPIRVTDINVSATFLSTGKSYDIEGKWIQDGKEVLYLTGDFEKAFFRTSNSQFKKQGPYDIHLIFFQKKSDLQATDVAVGFSCPGFPCEKDVDCDYDEKCSDGVCTALKCKEGEFIEFNECISKCNDFNPCTIDIYEDGNCTYERKKGECCRRDSDCDQGRACTIDKCVANKCIEQKVICESANDECVVGTCVEPEGCVYETHEVCLANENEKREYLIVIGEPDVEKKPFLSGFFEAIGNFFSKLF